MLKKLFHLGRAAEVHVPVRATMAGVVRRFQGTFECGCYAHPLDEPHTCPVHNVPKAYAIEPLEVSGVKVIPHGA